MTGIYKGQGGVDMESIYVNDYAMIDQYAKTGSLWSAGYDSWGTLGDAPALPTNGKSSPVQTSTGGTNWKQVAFSGYADSAAIKTDGTLWCWGQNAWGQAGNNTENGNVATNGITTPVQTIAGGTNWKQLDCGYGHNTAVKTDGTLWVWGYNDSGQLGDNTIANKSSPVQTIAGGNNWKQVSAGAHHTAAIKTDGTLWVWGTNGEGELGDNTVVSKSSPVQTIAGGNNWKQVSATNAYSCGAIKTDGTLWVWGYNGYGQLGDNTIANKSSPVQTIAGGTNWKQVAISQKACAAIKTDGTLWVWGDNSYGQLGNNTIVKKSSPVQTISGGTNWKQISVNTNNMAAIKTDGTLWVWGDNSYGQLGNNTIVKKSSPIQTIAGGNNWKQAAAGLRVIGAIYFYDAGNLYPSA
jgi:alpha-tubulin suppressor-like RCC1 family protein